MRFCWSFGSGLLFWATLYQQRSSRMLLCRLVPFATIASNSRSDQTPWVWHAKVYVQICVVCIVFPYTKTNVREEIFLRKQTSRKNTEHLHVVSCHFLLFGVQLIDWLIDWLRFNGTSSKNRLHHAFEKYVAVKKSEINEKVDNVTSWEHMQ